MSIPKSVHRSSTLLRRSVAVALSLALLGTSAVAGAQTAKEVELEKRVADLEKMVQQLVAEKQAAPAPAAAPVAAAPAKPDPKAIQPGAILPNAAPGHELRDDGLRQGRRPVDRHAGRRDGWTARAVASTTSPGRSRSADSTRATDFNAHAKQTRINIGTDTVLASGDKVSTRFEFDFYGSSSGEPERQQRLSADGAPCVRDVARMAGRPDLDQLHGRQRCCPRRPTTSARRTARSSYARRRCAGRKAACRSPLENPQTTFTKLRQRGERQFQRRQLLPGHHRALHLEGHLGHARCLRPRTRAQVRDDGHRCDRRQHLVDGGERVRQVHDRQGRHACFDLAPATSAGTPHSTSRTTRCSRRTATSRRSTA